MGVVYFWLRDASWVVCKMKHTEDGIEPFLSVREVCLLFGVSSKTIYRWIENRDMPTYYIGGILRFRASDLSVWVDGQNERKEIACKAKQRGKGKKVPVGVQRS